MRRIIYIGADYCASCNTMRTKIIEPLQKLYPDNVSIHHNFDDTVKAVDDRKVIDTVPLVVVERDGVEEIRFTGFVSMNELEDLILCDED